jgi:hypothetical protein
MQNPAANADQRIRIFTMLSALTRSSQLFVSDSAHGKSNSTGKKGLPL